MLVDRERGEMTLQVTSPKDGHGWYVEDTDNPWVMYGPYLSEFEATLVLHAALVEIALALENKP